MRQRKTLSSPETVERMEEREKTHGNSLRAPLARVLVPLCLVGLLVTAWNVPRSLLAEDQGRALTDTLVKPEETPPAAISDSVHETMDTMTRMGTPVLSTSSHGEKHDEKQNMVDGIETPHHFSKMDLKEEKEQTEIYQTEHASSNTDTPMFLRSRYIQSHKQSQHETNEHPIAGEAPPSTNSDLPAEIATATYPDFWYKHFQCEPLYRKRRAIPDQWIWMMLRGIYHGMMQPTHASAVRPLVNESSLQIPFDVDYSKGRGRGIFAREDIPKGTLIFTAKTGGHVHFTSGNDFRRYLYAVPRQWACEVLQCSAVEYQGTKENPESNPVITVDLDYSCFVNDANHLDEVNVGCIVSPSEDCIDNDYASRDIKAGEEIITNYGEYALGEEGWNWFTL